MSITSVNGVVYTVSTTTIYEPPSLGGSALTTITYWLAPNQRISASDYLTFTESNTLNDANPLAPASSFTVTVAIPATKNAGPPKGLSTITSASDSTTPVTSTSLPISTTTSTFSTNSESINTASSVTHVPATTSSQSAASSSSPPHSSSNTGGIVGAAIGCLIGGAIIAALITFFIMRKKQKSRHPARGFSEKRTTPHTSNRSPELNAPLIGGAAGAAAAVGASSWERHLPQSESDSTVRNAVQAMFTQVELHVDNYYRDSNVQMTPDLQQDLMKVDSSHLPDSVVGLIPQTRSPTLLIKHCLAQLMISRISLESMDAKDSFLPTDFTALPATLGSSTSSKPAFAPALCRWRVLTTYLRPSPRSDRSYLAARDAKISAAADVFSAAFAPWARQSQTPDSRRGHLVSIMKSASDTGILLFSQPSAFKYVWDIPKAHREGHRGMPVVVLPGFVKVGDESARVLERSQVMVEPLLGSL